MLGFCPVERPIYPQALTSWLIFWGVAWTLSYIFSSATPIPPNFVGDFRYSSIPLSSKCNNGHYDKTPSSIRPHDVSLTFIFFVPRCFAIWNMVFYGAFGVMTSSLQKEVRIMQMWSVFRQRTNLLLLHLVLLGLNVVLKVTAAFWLQARGIPTNLKVTHMSKLPLSSAEALSDITLQESWAGFTQTQLWFTKGKFQLTPSINVLQSAWLLGPDCYPCPIGHHLDLTN